MKTDMSGQFNVSSLKKTAMLLLSAAGIGLTGATLAQDASFIPAMTAAGLGANDYSATRHPDCVSAPKQVRHTPDDADLDVASRFILAAIVGLPLVIGGISAASIKRRPEKSGWHPAPARYTNIVIENTTPDTTTDSLAQKVLEVGDRLKDGTVCIKVDLKKNEALFVPEGIFGGDSDFDHQNGIVEKANAKSLHGHKDWRNITDDEGETLSEVWDKVAPDELKGNAVPWFWLTLPNYLSDGRVRRGGDSDWGSNYRGDSLPVPVVRSGPARC